jgi:hypothetical protein
MRVYAGSHSGIVSDHGTVGLRGMGEGCAGAESLRCHLVKLQVEG